MTGEVVGDGGPATSAHPEHAERRRDRPATGDLYIADMHHNRIRKVDARTRIITTVAGGAWGYSGDDGPATEARLAGPAGVAVVPEPGGKVTIFIADYYNGRVRAVGPDGHHPGPERREGARRSARRRAWRSPPRARGAAGSMSPIRARTGSCR